MHSKLKKLRNLCDYTSKDMAKMLNISRAYYTQLERGNRRLSYPMAISIADIFGVTPDKIFYEDYKDKE